ncbi:MAG: virulence protein RhuM/Fic/DOC family protein [Limnohabitans sp.]|nr:virulence protein RhuM/Fic/DOC family protein [Limnohabitans sp.]
MQKGEIEIFKSTTGAEIQVRLYNDTVWLDAHLLASLFNVKRPAIVKHIQNIYKSAELDKESTCSILEQVAADGRNRKMNTYNLDVIISVGYRVNSLQATQFRQWATQRLKDYLVKGYAINQKRLEENKTQFLQTLEDLKILTANNQHLETKEVLSLIQSFSETFFALESYDKNLFPTKGTIDEIKATAKELQQDLQQLKAELIKKTEATSLFAQEKTKGNVESIFGTVFQSVFGEDAYPTVEDKAAHLLYFIIKNHPFNDGNKRSGAFSFIWLLQKANYHFREKISPETLTALTILIAESKPTDKEKMIGIVLLILNSKN